MESSEKWKEFSKTTQCRCILTTITKLVKTIRKSVLFNTAGKPV